MIEPLFSGTDPKPSVMPYVWAALILLLMASLFILAVLVLRPNLDPLLLISAVAAVGGTLFTSVSAFIKTQETHLIVNSRLTAWKQDFFKAAHAEGMAAEQSRVAEQARLARAPPPEGSS